MGGVLFGIGTIRNLHGTIRRLERDGNGGFYAAGQTTDRIRYTIASESHNPSEAAIRGDVAHPPLRGDGERYLQLPELSPAVAELALQITAEAATDADRVRALETYLLVNGPEGEKHDHSLTQGWPP